MRKYTKIKVEHPGVRSSKNKPYRRFYIKDSYNRYHGNERKYLTWIIFEIL
jgi:hypothetical protein